VSIKLDAWGIKNRITFEVHKYAYGNGLAIVMNCEDGPYATLTVNLEDEPTSGDRAFVDVNNLSPEILTWIKKNNLGLPTGRQGFSGYCIYPEYEFNLEEINKHLTEETTK
jgi:hypothetical protein